MTKYRVATRNNRTKGAAILVYFRYAIKVRKIRSQNFDLLKDGGRKDVFYLRVESRNLARQWVRIKLYISGRVVEDGRYFTLVV